VKSKKRQQGRLHAAGEMDRHDEGCEIHDDLPDCPRPQVRIGFGTTVLLPQEPRKYQVVYGDKDSDQEQTGPQRLETKDRPDDRGCSQACHCNPSQSDEPLQALAKLG